MSYKGRDRITAQHPLSRQRHCLAKLDTFQIKICFAVISVFLVVGCHASSEPTYMDRRASFATTLVTVGPVPPGHAYPGPDLFPGDWERLATNIREVKYPSGDLQLGAWIFTPENVIGGRAPALLYLHPGLSADARTIRQCKPFMDSGFVVMVPTFRGEAGNDGNYEFSYGEVDDAAAAARWLAHQPGVDPTQIYAFGWSYGGSVAALLSLFDDLPLLHTGSCGGLLYPQLFDDPLMRELIPFDLTNPMEIEMRILPGNVRWMRRRHYAFIGTADQSFVPAVNVAQQEIGEGDSLLQILMVPGDHFTSAKAAIERYHEIATDQ